MDAFSFFDPIVDQKTATFEAAGALGAGERIWVLAKMPEVIKVVHGDECAKYLLLSNIHSDQGAVIVKFTTIRVVCQNTLLWVLQDGQQAFRIQHSLKMADRLAEVSRLIAAAKAAYEQAANADDYLGALFPCTEAQNKQTGDPPKWTEIKKLLREKDALKMLGVEGALWAAYNAVICFEDWCVR